MTGSEERFRTVADQLAESLRFMTDGWAGDPEWIEDERAALAAYDAAVAEVDQ